MRENVGRFDRAIRVTAGVPLLVVGTGVLAGVLTLPGGPAGAVVALVAGLLLVTTAFVRRCPLYDVFDLDTTRNRRAVER